MLCRVQYIHRLPAAKHERFSDNQAILERDEERRRARGCSISMNSTQELPIVSPISAAPISAAPAAPPKPRLWMPQTAQFTPAALEGAWGRQIRSRVEALGVPVEVLKSNRLTNLRGDDARATYNKAKRTLAVVNAAPGAAKLQPIPPSADWQFHLAEGCPAHCQYCYLAGSLAGPPVIRAFANLPFILDNLAHYEKPGAGRNEALGTTFEASCYTDPLSLEHLTGSLAETIRWFGTRENAYLRYTTKFDAVEPLLDLPHNGHTRPRASVNADTVARRLEGGVAPVSARLHAPAPPGAASVRRRRRLSHRGRHRADYPRRRLGSAVHAASRRRRSRRRLCAGHYI